MPDLLVVCLDDSSCFELEKFGRERNFRVKVSVELEVAAEWLKLRRFDVAFVDAGFSIEQQQKLAGLLWQGSILAPFVVFDLDSSKEALGREARLYGAEVARGPDVWKKLDTCLSRVAQREYAKEAVRADDFKVMVVEDLDAPRDIICTYVESLGYPKVVGHPSARAALNDLQSHPGDYSCIITDVRMPEMSGKELVHIIRQDSRLQHLPVVVLTAYGTVDSLIDCLRAGVSGFLIKPPKKKHLSFELARALRIMANHSNPRLATPEEAEAMQDLLVDRGFM